MLACLHSCEGVLLCACSQVVGLSVEGDVVQVHVDVRVVFAADPSDGRAVERGARVDVGLRAGRRIRILGGHLELFELEGQRPGHLLDAAEWQRRPAWREEEKKGT